MDQPAALSTPEPQEPEPLLSRQQFRSKLREIQGQAESETAKLKAELAKVQAMNQAIDSAGRKLAIEVQRAQQINGIMRQDFETAIRTAWPRLTDAEKAPLLEFWKRLGHKDPPGPMSGPVLVGG